MNLRDDKLLSIVAFNCNLRHYTEGVAAANGAGKTRDACPEAAGPTARGIHGARETSDIVDFCLAEMCSTMKVEGGDVSSEEWEGAVCAHLDTWGPTGTDPSRPFAGVDSNVADAAAAGMQSVVRRFIAKRRLVKMLQDAAAATVAAAKAKEDAERLAAEEQAQAEEEAAQLAAEAKAAAQASAAEAKVGRCRLTPS